MNLALIGNFDKEISPTSRGGTEVFVFSLVNELVKHDTISHIDVYGVGQSFFKDPKITFIQLVEQETSEFIHSNALLHTLEEKRPDFLSEVRFGIACKIVTLLCEKKYDVIHDNSTSIVFNAFSQMLPSPLVTTLHTNVDSPSVLIPHSLDMLKTHSKSSFIAIANHQIETAKKLGIDIHIVNTVYNGINLDNFVFNIESLSDAYGLWVGRISRKHNKGLKDALLATKEAQVDLTVLTSIDDRAFYDSDIKPNLHKNLTFIDQTIDLKGKNMYYRNASYFIYPIGWEEPFGLVFLEAMASGTPIIAYARGSVPEIVVDGITGFIVNPDGDKRGDWIIKEQGVKGLVEAIKRIRTMTEKDYKAMRKACQERVENHFTVEKMAKGYLDVYKQIASKP